VKWNGQDDRGTTVASGVYFCKMTAGKFNETRRMVMLKPANTTASRPLSSQEKPKCHLTRPVILVR
jgi:hypothetical protein